MSPSDKPPAGEGPTTDGIPPGDEKEICASAFERAQEAELAGRLQAARASFVRCAADTCPLVLGAPCVKAVQRLDAEIPSIVIAARSAAGAELRDVRVLVDGEERAERLDGKAIPLDPGSHRVRLERAGSTPVERDMLIRVGERNRPLDVSFTDLRPPGPGFASGARMPAPDPRGPWTKTAAIASLVIGGAGLAVGAVAGGLALANKLELDRTCPSKATCDPSAAGQIEAMKVQSTVSTVGFVAGAAGLALGTVLFVITARSPGPTKVSLTLGPGSIGLRGSF